MRAARHARGTYVHASLPAPDPPVLHQELEASAAKEAKSAKECADRSVKKLGDQLEAKFRAILGLHARFSADVREQWAQYEVRSRLSE